MLSIKWDIILAESVVKRKSVIKRKNVAKANITTNIVVLAVTKTSDISIMVVEMAVDTAVDMAADAIKMVYTTKLKNIIIF